MWAVAYPPKKSKQNLLGGALSTPALHHCFAALKTFHALTYDNFEPWLHETSRIRQQRSKTSRKQTVVAGRRTRSIPSLMSGNLTQTLNLPSLFLFARSQLFSTRFLPGSTRFCSFHVLEMWLSNFFGEFIARALWQRVWDKYKYKAMRTFYPTNRNIIMRTIICLRTKTIIWSCIW